MRIIVPGKPIAQARPRFYRKGNYVGTYNPQATEAGLWLSKAYEQVTDRFEGPLRLHMAFIMPIPKAWSKKQRAQLIEKTAYHNKKPDIDNLIKFVFDCLNGMAWKDDSQIAVIYALKLYGENPKTEIIIKGKFYLG